MVQTGVVGEYGAYTRPKQLGRTFVRRHGMGLYMKINPIPTVGGEVTADRMSSRVTGYELKKKGK